MSLRFESLDVLTRTQMLAEVDFDQSRGRLYLSPRLSPVGLVGYEGALREAITNGNDATLAAALGRFLNAQELSHSRYGKPFWKRVPADAHLTLAEAEFNRFYIRALCVRAEELGLDQVQIYRAKMVYSPRWESESRIGALVSASALLRDLRASVGIEPALGVPAGPNSGLSVRLLRAA